ncbi:hypothetical protein QN362_04795 [Actimicrobium sp. CCC2.4]|uniref:hypothetical protein n=1 Tax=Actimicrobium sp. CCC2.4 TaxID=3048606 RepID=UPI002AC955C9|nr:hypothetical protein [Actimicrobium sp. CCC2.4]MEB0134643.1 hypothetical protein [Actimicrobium sp. CCC2.4]WPX30587.1 hypothetical protein RHM62_09880 [Actimicrobium sp. CCC2.4]
MEWLKANGAQIERHYADGSGADVALWKLVGILMEEGSGIPPRSGRSGFAHPDPPPAARRSPLAVRRFISVVGQCQAHFLARKGQAMMVTLTPVTDPQLQILLIDRC